MLCGGMSVAMPTAMPVVPLSSRFGSRAGSRVGSCRCRRNWLPVDRAQATSLQQHFGIGRQARLGITHGGKRFRVIDRAEIALAINQRITIGKRLGHQHHGLVAGGVTVRMKFADHITHGACRFLVLGSGRQTQLAHRINDAPLHRFEAVADMRQRPVQHHVHGVIQIGLSA